jgi:dihydroneopterin aldolase
LQHNYLSYYPFAELNEKELLFTDHYELFIQGLRLWVSLGCSVEERYHLQPINIDIKVAFSHQPLGCQSDQLSDVLCYKMVVERIIETLHNQSFNLIESLAARIFDAIADQLTDYDQQGVVLEVVIAKPNHPVESVHGAITFTYRRSLPQKSS